MGVFWNSAHQERLLTLVSPIHLHWLPGKNQFYPASRLQLARLAFATSDDLCCHKDFLDFPPIFAKLHLFPHFCTKQPQCSAVVVVVDFY